MFLGGYYCGKLLRWEKATLQQVTFDLRPVNIYLFVSWKRVNPLKCHLAWTLQKLQTPFWRRKLASIQIFMCFNMKLKFSCYEIIFDNFFLVWEDAKEDNWRGGVKKMDRASTRRRWKVLGKHFLFQLPRQSEKYNNSYQHFFRLIICQMNSTCLT